MCSGEMGCDVKYTLVNTAGAAVGFVDVEYLEDALRTPLGAHARDGYAFQREGEREPCITRCDVGWLAEARAPSLAEGVSWG